MEIPLTFECFGKEINFHFIFETLAFFIAFRYYVWLKKRTQDPIDTDNRLWIILGAAIGALIGSRLLGALESPSVLLEMNWIRIYQSKTIIGGLFGGLIGVELIKKIVKEQQSSGDLFVFPIIIGIAIGRIGCWLTGTLEPTYGTETIFFMGMDLGDGLLRHPTALYEFFFLMILFTLLRKLSKKITFKNGSLFQLFMVSYFGFRFFMEFIKPNTFFLLGLSSIQWCCVLCFIYYYKVFLHPKSLVLR